MEQQLFSGYGDNSAAQVQTRVRFKTQDLFAGSETEMYASLRILNKYKLPVSDFTPDEVKERVEVFCNGQKLNGLVATTRVGEFRLRFLVRTENTISVSYDGHSVFSQRYTAKPTFEPQPGASIDGCVCTALVNNVVVRLQEPFVSGRGRVMLHFSGPSLCGYGLGSQTCMVPVDGRVEVTGLGDAMRIAQHGSDTCKILKNIANQTVSVCFRLRRDRVCEIVG